MSNLSDYQNVVAQREQLAKRKADRKAAHERLEKPASKESKRMNLLLRSRGPNTITIGNKPKPEAGSEFFNSWIRGEVNVDEEPKGGELSSKMNDSILGMSDSALNDIVSTDAEPRSIMSKAKAVATKELERRKRRNADG